MTATDWVTAVAAVATLIAAIAAAISAKASRDTARILKTEHDLEGARKAIEPLLTLQRLLEEFVATIPETEEGTQKAEELHRRIEFASEDADVDEPFKRVPATLRFVEEVNVATVAMAESALEEVAWLIRGGR